MDKPADSCLLRCLDDVLGSHHVLVENFVFIPGLDRYNRGQMEDHLDILDEKGKRARIHQIPGHEIHRQPFDSLIVPVDESPDLMPLFDQLPAEVTPDMTVGTSDCNSHR